MKETTEFNYQGVQLRYNPETGQCWKQWKNGEWVLVTAGTMRGKYTQLRIGANRLALHRIIAEVFLNAGKQLTTQQIVDHREHANGSHRQDRISNLRICSKSQNAMNQKLSPANTSGYKGVYWHTTAGKWKAQIMSCGLHKCLGYFTTPEAAALAYDKAAKELHGEFARLNFSTGSFL